MRWAFTAICTSFDMQQDIWADICSLHLMKTFHLHATQFLTDENKVFAWIWIMDAPKTKTAELQRASACKAHKPLQFGHQKLQTQERE